MFVVGGDPPLLVIGRVSVFMIGRDHVPVVEGDSGMGGDHVSIVGGDPIPVVGGDPLPVTVRENPVSVEGEYPLCSNTPPPLKTQNFQSVLSVLPFYF